MKTRNNNLKETAVKTISLFTTIFVIVLVLSVSAFAANTSSGNSSLFNLLTEEKDAEINVEEWMLNTNNFYFDYTLEEATEANLEIENWKVNENSFGYHLYLEIATEESLEVENRMLKDSLFSKKDKTKAKEKSESEKEVEVLAEVKTENRKKAVGVTSQKTQFGRRAMILIEDEDPKLKMEQWMLDYRHWKTK
jgi:hypothetical protein